MSRHFHQPAGEQRQELWPDAAANAFFNRYWSDAAYRERLRQEADDMVRLAHRSIDAGMASLNAKQAARWAAEGDA